MILYFKFFWSVTFVVICSLCQSKAFVHKDRIVFFENGDQSMHNKSRLRPCYSILFGHLFFFSYFFMIFLRLEGPMVIVGPGREFEHPTLLVSLRLLSTFRPIVLGLLNYFLFFCSLFDSGILFPSFNPNGSKILINIT